MTSRETLAITAIQRWNRKRRSSEEKGKGTQEKYKEKENYGATDMRSFANESPGGETIKTKKKTLKSSKNQKSITLKAQQTTALEQYRGCYRGLRKSLKELVHNTCSGREIHSERGLLLQD